MILTEKSMSECHYTRNLTLIWDLTKDWQLTLWTMACPVTVYLSFFIMHLCYLPKTFEKNVLFCSLAPT